MYDLPVWHNVGHVHHLLVNYLLYVPPTYHFKILDGKDKACKMVFGIYKSEFLFLRFPGIYNQNVRI